jgi:hypothetical protein
MVSEINSGTDIDDKAIQPPTFQTEDNNETQSYATADSQDPTHENFEQELRATSQPRPSQDRYPFSPPVPDYPDNFKNASTNPIPHQAKSDNDIILTQHQHHKTHPTQTHAQGTSCKQPSSQETHQLSKLTNLPQDDTTTTTSRNDPATTSPWQVVSASK